MTVAVTVALPLMLFRLPQQTGLHTGSRRDKVGEQQGRCYSSSLLHIESHERASALAAANTLASICSCAEGRMLRVCQGTEWTWVAGWGCD